MTIVVFKCRPIFYYGMPKLPDVTHAICNSEPISGKGLNGELGEEMTGSLTIFLDGTGDDAIDLHKSLNWDRKLHGRARLVPVAAPRGTLGAHLTQLLVTLESGGMATAFATVLVTWIKKRAGSVTAKVTLPDGTAIELTAERVRGLKPEDLQKQIEQLAAMSWPREAAAITSGGENPDGTA
jgi:hypothetical protein